MSKVDTQSNEGQLQQDISAEINVQLNNLGVERNPELTRRIQCQAQEECVEHDSFAHRAQLGAIIGMNNEQEQECARQLAAVGQNVERRSSAATLQRNAEFFEQNPIKDLPDGNGVTFLRQNAQGYINRNGVTQTLSGSDEVDVMQDISKRLEMTSAIDHEILTVKPSGQRKIFRNSYLSTTRSGTVVIDRHKIGKDIAWLSDRKRIEQDASTFKTGSPSHKRDQYFRAYRDYLVQLTSTLVTPQSEQEYIRKYGPDYGTAQILERSCPHGSADAIRGAGRAALVLAVGALLTLWAIKDLRQKTFSLATLVTLGAMLFLVQGGSKHSFVASKSFSRLTGKDGPLTKDRADELHGLAKSNSQAYGHLLKFAEERGSDEITQEDVDYFAASKDHKGKDHPEKQEAAKFAQHFVGHTGADVYKVLRGIRKYKGNEMELLNQRIEDRNHGVDMNNEITTALSQTSEVQAEAKEAAAEEYNL